MRVKLIWMRLGVTNTKSFSNQADLEDFKKLLFKDDKVDWVKTDPTAIYTGRK